VIRAESTPRSVIVGQGPLALHCANVLSKGGHELVAVSTVDDRFRKWAQRQGIPVVDDLSAIPSLSHSTPFDYLFSIVNYRILPASLLKAPRRFAVNYHDALLPRYAGTYATTWAIMNGESRHGITWHIMTEEVDAGDILKQVAFPIGPEDTAASLNVRCHYEAIGAFSRLVDELSAGTERRIPQDLSARTYFELSARPEAGCLISFDSAARNVDCFVRALTFGSHPNPIGSPKISVGERYFAVGKAEITPCESTAAPGVVTGIDDDALLVATITQNVRLSGVTSLRGGEITTAVLRERHELAIGTHLNSIDTVSRGRITTLHQRACRHEGYWAGRLAGIQPAAFEIEGCTYTRPRGHWRTLEVHLNEAWAATLDSCFGGVSWAEALLALSVVFLSQEASLGRDFGFVDSELADELTGLEELFAVCVPVHVDSACPATTARQMTECVLKDLKKLTKRQTYLRDIVIRYPGMNLTDLNGDPGSDSLTLYPIVFCLNHGDLNDRLFGTQMTVSIGLNRKLCQWHYDGAAIPETSVAALMARFVRFAVRALSEP
jgi:methionyl-tRNA formyltransferase